MRVEWWLVAKYLVSSILQFLTGRNYVCVVDGMLTVHCSEAGGRTDCFAAVC